eukprot:746841-Hanusia_phi.AAC.3
MGWVGGSRIGPPPRPRPIAGCGLGLPGDDSQGRSDHRTIGLSITGARVSELREPAMQVWQARRMQPRSVSRFRSSFKRQVGWSGGPWGWSGG